MRLFVAVELPEAVKEQLSCLRTDIQDTRWMPPGQLHLTLAFLGDVSDETQTILEKQLDAIKLPGFPLQLTKPGCFPDRRRPRVLWVGIRQEPLLVSLASRIREAVLACGISQEERQFSPHITMARIRSSGPANIAPFLENPIQSDIQEFHVSEFVLFNSVLSATGANHVPLRVFRLEYACQDERLQK